MALCEKLGIQIWKPFLFSLLRPPPAQAKVEKKEVVRPAATGGGGSRTERMIEEIV